MLLSAIPVKIYPLKLSEKPLFTMSKSKQALRTNMERKCGMSRASLSRIFLESQMSAFGKKADIFQGVAKSPLIAKSGHLLTRPVGCPGAANSPKLGDRTAAEGKPLQRRRNLSKITIDLKLIWEMSEVLFGY